MQVKDDQKVADVPVAAIVGNNGQPAWVTKELPGEYGELAAKIRALQEEAGRFEKVAAVLWQTGTPLVLAVRDLFRALNFDADVSESGAASRDLVVTVEGDRRMLVQVVGGPDPITRKAPEISQILRVLQEDAEERDRVVVVANVQCDMPPDARREEPVEKDALRLIQGLGANFITTTTLFGVWRYSLKDLPGARKSIVRLHAQDGGIFR